MNKSYAIGIDIYGNEHRFEINPFGPILCYTMYLKTLTVYDESNELIYLYCFRNQLESLTIIGGKNIIYIQCEKNNLKELDLSMCTSLKYLNCDVELENGLKLSNNKQLEWIFFYE